MAIILQAWAFVFLALGFLLSQRRKMVFNPAVLFVLSSSVMYFGTLRLANLESQVDQTYLWILFVGMAAFIYGNLITGAVLRVAPSKVEDWRGSAIIVKEPRLVMATLVVMLTVSIGMSFLYFHLLGYNIFLDSVISLARTKGLVEGVAERRLAAYSGDRYFAPGYFNQFKNTLLPFFALLFLGRSSYTRQKGDFWVGWALLPIAVMSLLGTGQRGAFVLAFLTSLVYFSHLPRTRGETGRMAGWAISGVVMFVLATAFLGRSLQGFSSFRDIFVLFGEILDRIIKENQVAGLVGFRVVYAWPIQFGREWVTALSGILPGRGGSTLANEVYAVLFGSTRGTAPLSMMGSIWHNFGWPGVIIGPALFGAVCHGVHWKSLRTERRLPEFLVWSGVTVLLGTWVAGDPMSILNNGLLTMGVFYFTIRGIRSYARPRRIRQVAGCKGAAVA